MTMSISILPQAVFPPPDLEGVYLTDERSLYRVGARLGGTDLWQVEDCRTLDLLLLPDYALRSSRLRRVA